MTALGDVADVRMGYPFRSRLEHDPYGHVTVIQMRDIDDTSFLHLEDAVKVVLPDSKEHHQLQTGDLLFRSRGRSYTVAQVAGDIGDAVLAAPMLMIRPRQAVLPAYLHWYINLPQTQAVLGSMATGTAVQMISKDALMSLELPVPGIEEQRRIVDLAALAQREQALMADIAIRRRLLVEGVLTRYAKNSR